MQCDPEKVHGGTLGNGVLHGTEGRGPRTPQKPSGEDPPTSEHRAKTGTNY